MNFKTKNMLAIALLLSVPAVFASAPALVKTAAEQIAEQAAQKAAQIALEKETTSKALTHLFPDFHTKTKKFILSGVELGRTFVEGVWKITQPELQKIGTYIKGNFTGDLINTHTGEGAHNTNLDIAKSIGAKTAAAFILYDIGYWAQKMREHQHGLASTRGYFAWAFSEYSNDRGYAKRDSYVRPCVKNVLRATLVTSLVV